MSEHDGHGLMIVLKNKQYMCNALECFGFPLVLNALQDENSQAASNLFRTKPATAICAGRASMYLTWKQTGFSGFQGRHLRFS